VRGTVLWFSVDRGYGFVKPVGGHRDVFLHAREIEHAGIGSLNPGAGIEFDVAQEQGGRLYAVNLKLHKAGSR
jgi:CspA family cold shock protein